MLAGTLQYTNEYGTVGYQVTGHDSTMRMALEISSTNMASWTGMTFEDFKAEENRNRASGLSKRRIDIGSSKVKIEVLSHVSQETGKRVKEPINSDFFCRLSALIRYAKVRCNRQTEIGNTFGGLASGEFEVITEKEYVIPMPDGSGTLAEITLEYDYIKAIRLKTPHIDLDLRWDDALIRQFFDIKNAQILGYKTDETYMGITVPKRKPVVLNNTGDMHTCIEDIVAANPDKEFAWLLDNNYIIVTDKILEEVCDKIYNHDGYVYYDTETTGLNINFKSILDQADYLAGIVLSIEDGESYYFPARMQQIPNLCGGDHAYFMEKYMRRILEEKDLIAHNMAFDWKVAYIYGINANIVHDTMALYKLTIAAEFPDYPTKLKILTKNILGRDSLELSDLLVDNEWGEVDVNFTNLPAELVRLYACADTDNTRGIFLYAMNNDLLVKYGATDTYKTEIAFSYAVAYQEFYGHKVNTDKIGVMRKDIEKGQAKAMEKMVELNHNQDFNPNSSKQLVEILYSSKAEGGQGIPEQISSKTGRITTDKKTLKKLAGQTDIDGNIMYPFCAALLEYREYEGIRKIIDKFPEHMTSDGYVFSRVQQYGTTTGRVSVKAPNYQSYNDAVKKHIVPRPGFWMFDTDYSSVEYRILGSMVLNRPIMKSFEDPDFDYHAYQAAHMNRIPYSAVTKRIRKAAKSINFGIPYGMGDPSLGEIIFGEKSDANTREAKKLKDAYFVGQEDIRDWFEAHRDNGVNKGYTETYFGRRRYYQKAKFSDASIRRQAGNQVIQGTAADIYKKAVGNVFKRICAEGMLGKVLFTGFIHDELLGEVSNDINPTVFLKILREEFEVQVESDVIDPETGKKIPWCPLYMGFGYGTSWYEAKSVELPIMMQKELVELYGETGIPTWEGDARTFCDKVPDMLRSFSIRDSFRQLRDKDAQGKEIKPALDKALMAILEVDKEEYPEALAYYKEHGEWSDKWYIRGELDEINITTDTQANIDMLCQLHAEDRSNINVLNIPEYIADESNTDMAMHRDNEGFEDSKAAAKANRIAILEQLGVYADYENQTVTYMWNPRTEEMLKYYAQNAWKDPKGYTIRLWVPSQNKTMEVQGCKVSTTSIRTHQEQIMRLI